MNIPTPSITFNQPLGINRDGEMEIIKAKNDKHYGKYWFHDGLWNGEEIRNMIQYSVRDASMMKGSGLEEALETAIIHLLSGKLF